MDSWTAYGLEMGIKSYVSYTHMINQLSYDKYEYTKGHNGCRDDIHIYVFIFSVFKLTPSRLQWNAWMMRLLALVM